MADFLKEEEKEELLKWKKWIRSCFFIPFRFFLILSLHIRKRFKLFSVLFCVLMSICFIIIAVHDFQVEKCETRKRWKQKRNEENYSQCRKQCWSVCDKFCWDGIEEGDSGWEECAECHNRHNNYYSPQSFEKCNKECKHQYDNLFFGFCGEKSFFNLFN